jgi:hypothetical protein
MSFMALLASACVSSEAVSDGRAATTQARAQLLYEHGIDVGDKLDAISVACSDAAQRTFAEAKRLQLVTLSSVDDYCAECDRHLRGLDAVSKRAEMSHDAFILTYGAPARHVDIVTAYAPKTNRPVCFDETGRVWERHDLRHTPLTLLLWSGQVVYAHDGPLDDSTVQGKVARAITDFRRK